MTTSTWPPQPGSLLAGRYAVQRLIGSGARKQVHLAHDTWLDRDVAVCTVQDASEEAARLRREAALLARLGAHPGVVAVHDLIEVDGAPVMICQYLPGGALPQVLRGAPVEVDAALRIATDIAAALGRAHQHDIVHRDVKPANIWLDAEGRAVLGDFGLAVGGGVEAQPYELLVGTAAYAAPEQIVGDRGDPRSDLYSLGAVLFELLTGRPPLDGSSLLGVISKVLQETPAPPSQLRPDLPRGTDELLLALLAKDPQARPASADELLVRLAGLTTPQRPRTPGGRRSGFVGRTSEMDVLREALDEATAGRGSLTLLLGEPGIGKTRTALELAHAAAAQGCIVLTGRCHDTEAAPAFWPWRQVLQAAVRHLPEQDWAGLQHRPLLAALVPDLGLGGAPDELPDHDASRFLLFHAVAALLTRLAVKAPVLVLLDDGHWADTASCALTAYVGRELSTARVALVVAARDVDEQEHPAGAARVAELSATATRTLALHGLSPTDTASFLEGAMHLTPDPWLLRELHSRTDGNPFYVAELVRLLQSEHRITDQGALLPGAQLVPRSVREVLHRRLRQVSPECARLLATMSVIGREVLLSVLCHVEGCKPEQALGLLDEAIQARLAVHVPASRGSFRFSHALVREALYDELPAGRRAQLHRRVMAALLDVRVGTSEVPASEMAHHAVRALVDGELLPAVVWSVRAGRQARLSSAHEDAVLHYGRAVELASTTGVPKDADVPAFGELLLELGEAQRRLGQAEQARLTFLRAAGDAMVDGDAELLGRAALGYGLGLGGFGFVEHADGVLLSLLEEAAAALGEQDSPLRMRVLARLATELYFTPFRSRRRVLSQQALDMAARLGDPAGELLALYSATLARLGPDRFEERRRTAERVLWLATSLGDHEMAFRGHHLRLMVALESGNLEQARAEVSSCRRIAEDFRQPGHDWHAGTFEAMLPLAAGRFEEGLRLSHRALQSGQHGSPEMAQVMHGAQVLVVHWAQGRMDEVVDASSAFADRYPHAPAWRAAYAFCCTEIARMEEARRQLEMLAGRDFADLPEDGNYLTTASLLAHVAARLGDVTRARQLEAKLRPYADRHVVIAAGAVAFTCVRLALGVTRAACGDLDGALRDLTRAYQVHRTQEAAAYAVWCGEELVRQLLRRGGAEDLVAARETLAECLPVARELGMRRHLARLEELAAQAGGAHDVGPQQGECGGTAVTVLICDVAGSTALTERLGERAMHALLTDHRRVVEAAAADEGGVVLKMLGDAVLSAFPSADGALRCAARLQQHYEDVDGSPLRVRIGVHTGPVLRQGDSMYGRTMILAFRVADRARAGEILVSSQARAAVSTDLVFEQPELLSLKGIAQPQPVHRLSWKLPRGQD